MLQLLRLDEETNEVKSNYNKDSQIHISLMLNCSLIFYFIYYQKFVNMTSLNQNISPLLRNLGFEGWLAH